ncbi:MAG: AAA family ATPase [Nitrospirae bacterium]|uniref:AAA family ATPase n=1 Tax=Candidatus Magnetobacterium casense TaxID=1455061 RepID=UPI00138E17BB|nr:AAA family ATPase [Candidatus Magnetobacterium casensis]MBF0337440.1 AAA family ATPase [Nitrospirota bacterium]
MKTEVVMRGNIERFQIIGLHGYKNLDIRIEDNTIILVGENGTGKTTVLRLLCYFLAGRWDLLSPYEFARLVVTVDGSEHELSYGIIEKYVALQPNVIQTGTLRRFLNLKINPPERGFGLVCLKNLKEKQDENEDKITKEVYENLKKSEDKLNKELYANLKKSIDAQILYLPTYRRIEQDLESIFGENYKVPRKRSDSYIELIEFGMDDVKIAIEWNLKEIKDFIRENLNSLTLGYLGDVVDERYSEVKIEDIQNKSEDAIKLILDRIQENILSKDHKQHLLEKIKKVKQGGYLDEHAKVICHYLLKLLQFQEKLSSNESRMRTFCDVCNEYLVDKRLDYDSANLVFSIKLKEPSETRQDIELEYLSSGEKQIVSLFSQLYLSDEGRYIVIIDEPELSLSLPWQRRFLPDIKNGTFCSGLIVATHSPFVYDNELERYTHGLGEFYE